MTTPDALTTPGFHTIVIGVDFSPSSLHALDVARQNFPGARRRLLHITDARATTAPDLMGGVTAATPDPELLRTLEHADAQRLSRIVLEGEDAELLTGDPVTGILDAAERCGADLIVVGTHAQGALEHFFLGSSAEKIVSRSRIPVLTVRHPDPGAITKGAPSSGGALSLRLEIRGWTVWPGCSPHPGIPR